MNKIVFTLLSLIVILLSACRKVERDVMNYYPKVKTVSAVVMPDGSAVVTGEIISAGNTEILYRGFCMDTVANPNMRSNQQNLELSDDNTFTATYTGLDKMHKYYFRAWAANEDGYDIGEDVMVENVTISPATIPCSLPLDTITFDNSYTVKHEKYDYKSSITQSTLTWKVHLTSNTHSLDLEFGRKPIGGVYSVAETVSDKTEVGIFVDNVQITSGAKVYVEEIDADTIKVTVCELQFYDGSVVNKVKTSFKVSF